MSGTLAGRPQAAWQALRAEWTKAWTLPGTPWLLLAVVAVTVALSAAAAAAVTCAESGCTAGSFDTTKLSLTGVLLGQALVAVLGVMMVAGEYGTGMISCTLAAVPRRWTVLGAKAGVLIALVLSAGTVAVLGSVLAGRLLLPGNGFSTASGFPPLSLDDSVTLRAAGGSVLYFALIGLLSLGVATALRDAATAVGVVLGVLYLSPVLVQVISDPGVRRHLRQLSPATAGLAVQATVDLPSLPIGPWAGLGVLAVWAAAALACGGLVLQLRDA